MKIQLSKTNGIDIKSDGLVITMTEEDTKKLSGIHKIIDSSTNGAFSSLIKNKSLKGKLGEVKVFRGVKDIKASTIFVVGVGSLSSISSDTFRQASGNLIRTAELEKLTSLVWSLRSSGLDKSIQETLGHMISEGAILGRYTFDQFKSDPTDNTVSTLTVATEDKSIHSSISGGIKKGVIIANATNAARDLANAPANILTPATVVSQVKKWFPSGSKVSIKVIDTKEATKLKMGAFLGVSQGSSNPGYMIVMNYKGGSKSDAPLCLVGKGVTFDTGGISIKPSKSMSEMKADMSGAATVIGTMKAISQLSPKVNVTALIPLAENSPSHTAQRPGDIVTAMNGKTIEVLNTDAEGRLIMCDAISYAIQKIKPAEIIDIATLTGACVVALGTYATAILGNSDEMITQMKDISDITGERVWQLPLYDEHLELLNSDVADIANCYEGREAGTSTAAKFLEQFVDDTPWLHMDMAGVMSYSSAKGSKIKGMSAEGTRNLLEYVLRYN